MSGLVKTVRGWVRQFVLALLIGGIAIALSIPEPAYADTSRDVTKYISAEGRDLTAVAECLPKQLSQPNLARALRESGNDFIEKVFGLKENYDDYKLDETEVEYLNCLEDKGVTPQVKR